MQGFLEIIRTADLSIGKSRGKGLGAFLLAAVMIFLVEQGSDIASYGAHWIANLVTTQTSK